MTSDDARAAELREALVGELVAGGHIKTAAVEAAFRAVPRHMFAPDAPLEKAYAQDIVEVKRNEHGVLISTISAPQIQALQLEQAEIGLGMRVLEIGSGGFNAALIAEIVGPEGQVTTMDIDPEVTSGARRFLDSAGYSRVRVITADAEYGLENDAPFDRILVTVGAWDIPPAWRQQLAKGGRLVVPLRMKGVTRSLALERTNDHLVSVSQGECGFVPMQGSGAHDEHLWLLRDKKVGLRFDDGNLDEPHLLDGVLATKPAAAWSGVTVLRSEPFPNLPLRMLTALPGFCKLSVDASEGDPGLAFEPGGRWFPWATVEGDSFAYLSCRPSGEGVVEFGAHGYGPHGWQVANAIVEQVRVWDRDYRNGPSPDFAVWPIDTPDDVLPAGAVINKRHTRVTIAWPEAAEPSHGQVAPPPTQ
ncbi:methyltransferase, FxLD system [Nonomuraea basaltis]|uniref:methyltransferase, FxLD system n=1 Tax=Nonomuraea basaltis TaxID=2495887 RepID=UPI001F0E90AD|nr:methyltransferase, FxLD system [Nonomuraea basaltis]